MKPDGGLDNRDELPHPSKYLTAYAARLDPQDLWMEGVEKVRPYTVALIDEVADGGWGQGGRALTLEQLQRAVAT